MDSIAIDGLINRDSTCDFSNDMKEILSKKGLSLETRFGFCIKMCMKNAFCLRTINLQLSRNLDFTRRKFFCPFDDIEKVYYELLPQGETINSVKYCNQLDKLRTAIEKKRPELANRRGIVFHHDMQNRVCIGCKRKAVTVWLERSTTFSSVFSWFCSIRLLFGIKKFLPW